MRMCQNLIILTYPLNMSINMQDARIFKTFLGYHKVFAQATPSHYKNFR